MNIAVVIGSCLILAVQSASVEMMEINDFNTLNEERAELQAGNIGYLYQRSSGLAVHPDGGSANPPEDTKIVLHSGTGEPRLQFQFVPMTQWGEYGYIRQVTSQKYVHPLGGSGNPADDTRLVLHSSTQCAALFYIDEQNDVIRHIGGKFWHPFGGDQYPDDNTDIVLYPGTHDGTYFYLGNANRQKISVL